MPRPPKTAPAPRRGHPGKPPRRTMSIRLDETSVEWLYANVPRPASFSDYVNEAVRAQIARDSRRAAR